MAQYFASGNGNIKYYRTFANRKYTDRFMKQIILITGGARSGKSSYAERLALSLSPNPVYLATSRIWDEEFRHQHRRRKGTEPPFFARACSADRLRNTLVYQLLLRP